MTERIRGCGCIEDVVSDWETVKQLQPLTEALSPKTSLINLFLFSIHLCLRVI